MRYTQYAVIFLAGNFRTTSSRPGRTSSPIERPSNWTAISERIKARDTQCLISKSNDSLTTSHVVAKIDETWLVQNYMDLYLIGGRELSQNPRTWANLIRQDLLSSPSLVNSLFISSNPPIKVPNNATTFDSITKTHCHMKPSMLVSQFRFLTASDTDGGGGDSGGDENGSGNEGSSGADEGGSGGGNEGVVAVAVVSKASAMMKTKMTMVRVSVVIGEAATNVASDACPREDGSQLLRDSEARELEQDMKEAARALTFFLDPNGKVDARHYEHILWYPGMAIVERRKQAYLDAHPQIRAHFYLMTMTHLMM
ncbi:hypothetical protein AX14_009863 [Amanita brunnescens Koide BX004]|nr:hypothetical protein AX14_009863 [Amanita brunnescens Koide BX004]